ncbi:MAG: hypothetical protein IJN25_09960 [Clostridia bacterium]|nr:hypothetical protein [Clostridia bacterium]
MCTLDVKKLGYQASSNKAAVRQGAKLRANNNKKRNFSENSLFKKIAHIDEQISEYLSSLDRKDRTNEDLQTLESRKTSFQDMLEFQKSAEDDWNYLSSYLKIFRQKKETLLRL